MHRTYRVLVSGSPLLSTTLLPSEAKVRELANAQQKELPLLPTASTSNTTRRERVEFVRRRVESRTRKQMEPTDIRDEQSRPDELLDSYVDHHVFLCASLSASRPRCHPGCSVGFLSKHLMCHSALTRLSLGSPLTLCTRVFFQELHHCATLCTIVELCRAQTSCIKPSMHFAYLTHSSSVCKKDIIM